MRAETGSIAVGLFIVGQALVVCAYAAYAAYLAGTRLLAAPRERSAWPLFAAVLASVAWGAASLFDLASSKVLAWHLAVLADHLRYVAWTVFMLALFKQTAPDGRLTSLRTALPAGVFFAGIAVNLYLAMSPGPVLPELRALIGVQLAWAVCGLVILEQLYRNQVESARWAAKPLCLGLACVFSYDLYLYSQGLMFGEVDPDALSARGLVHAMAVPLLLAASRRNAHWLARVQVSKTAAFYSASLLLAGAYLLFVAFAGYYVRYFGGTWGGALQVALLAAALVGMCVLALSASHRARVRVFLNKNFFSYRYDYRVEWLRFTAALSAGSTPQEVGQQVVRGLADLVECSAGGLWFKASEDGDFVQAEAWNIPRLDMREPSGTEFCRLMRDREWIVELSRADPKSPAPDWLPALGSVWLAVPLHVGSEMLGFVVLSRPRVVIELDWEVRDLLKTAARQAAGCLALMHATEALLETRKFDAFNRMSAFIVHDLKNIVTQLSLMLKNAERHRENPEFQKDMLSTVENSLDKMRQMMVQLREGEAPAGGPLGVELAPILQRLQEAARRRGRDFELRIAERTATRGHEQRLERVIDHVVQNALDATPATGSVWVSLERTGSRVKLLVGDTGAGMSQQFIQNRLFRPFNSTKPSGMGIGSYEALQYLRELGGGIDVASELGKGSLVTLWMPVFELRSGSDLSASPA